MPNKLFFFPEFFLTITERLHHLVAIFDINQRIFKTVFNSEIKSMFKHSIHFIMSHIIIIIFLIIN